ncbi:MAG: CNNM domain-containing protein [Lentisphaerota bacterium]
MNIPIELALIPLFMAGAWFLAGIETGIVSINRHRLLHLVRSGSRRAKLIEGYLLDSQRLFGTSLVGSNLCLVIVSTLVGSLSERAWGPIGQTVISACLAIILLVFCEYFPKIWFASRPIQRCLRFAPLLRAVETLLFPLSSIAVSLTRLMIPQKKEQSPFVTREHIQTLAQGSEAGGEITAFERLMINQVLDLQLKPTEQIMTPISRVVTVDPDDTLAACLDRVRGAGHIRLPVIDSETRACLGILDTFEVLTGGSPNPSGQARDHMIPPFFINADLHADDVLPLLRRHRQNLAIVRDPVSNAVKGIVTQDNILTTLLSGALPAAAKVPAQA